MSNPTVFISYSHKDEHWKDQLIPHLKMLQQVGRLTVWDDRKIDAGEKWYPEIEKAMSEAAVAVCLISSNYLASDFINKEEVPFLLKRCQQYGMHLILVLIHPCLWEEIEWIKEIQMIPRDGKSISEDFAGKENGQFTLVAKRIIKIISDPNYLSPKPPLPKWSPLPEASVYIERLPVTGSELFGRKTELEQLDNTWQENKLNVVSLVAYGGVGKSTLMNQWIQRLAEDNYRGAERVYAWSFYSQGTGERVTSANLFISEALKWFGDPDPTAGSPWDQGQRLANLVRQQKTLLLLDGMEPLQSYLEVERGKVKDPSLAMLLKELARENPGLCLISTREQIPDLEYYDETYLPVNLEQISPEAGRALLRVRGVQGSDAELETTVKQFGSHALAINLLATYLHDMPGHSISSAAKIPDLKTPEAAGKHPRRVMEAFANQFGNGPETELLQLLGLFDRPVDSGPLKILRKKPAIPGLTDHLYKQTQANWQKLLSKLRRYKLLASESEHAIDILDCHPLVREHFGEKLEENNPKAWQEAHSRLYEYYKSLPEKELPNTLEEMEPLFAAVAHGCQAGRHQEALDDVFWPKIRRGNKQYSYHKLGVYGADQSALSNFFEVPWRQPVSGLTDEEKPFVLSWAGFGLRALGRLREAAQPMRASMELHSKRENWKEAALNAGNLSEVNLTIGEVEKAVEAARQSVDFADRSGDFTERIRQQSILADGLFQNGEIEEAEHIFQFIESSYQENISKDSFLPSIYGFRFCSLLLGQGKYREVLTRAGQTLEWAKQVEAQLLTFALDTLSLGRAYYLQASDSSTPHKMRQESEREAEDYLNRAVAGLREDTIIYHVLSLPEQPSTALGEILPAPAATCRKRWKLPSGGRWGCIWQIIIWRRAGWLSPRLRRRLRLRKKRRN